MISALYLTPTITFLYVLARMAGLVLTAPLFGLRDVPWQVRGLLVVTLALVVTPLQWSASVPIPQTLPQFAVELAGEAMIGAILGVGVMIVLAGAQIAGQIVSQMSGLSLAETFHPESEESTPLFSQLFYLVALAVFVMIGGHRLLVGALLDSYTALPLGHVQVPPSLGPLLVTLLTESFSLGIRAAAPAIVALLLSTVVLGFVSRTLPQMNLLTVGLGLNVLVTFAALALSIGAVVWLFQEQFEPAVETICDTLRVHP